jgi:hypothetical protein
MNAHKMDRALGYTPCVCGVIDGTWHPECYAGKSDDDLHAGLARARRKARVMLETQAAMIVAAHTVGPNAELSGAGQGTATEPGRSPASDLSA